MVERSESLNSVARAVDVLNLFGRGTSTLGVTEIATELGLAKAVVHRILQAYKAKGYVEVDPTTRRYALGPNAVFLRLAHLDPSDVDAFAVVISLCARQSRRAR